jgi:FkbM family methyltransferase
VVGNLKLTGLNSVLRGISQRRAREVVQCARETAQWMPITLDYAGVQPIAYPYILRLRTGQYVTLREHTDTVIFWLVFARRHYPVSPAYRVIIDIGANIGTFTLYAAREAPQARIVSVEPFPETFRRLQEMVDGNGLSERVTILNCAVSSRAGEKKMDSAEGIPSQYRRIHSPETATLNAEHRGPAGALADENGVPIRAETLRYVLDQSGVSAVDLVKMNIHGSEYEVLLGTDAAVLQRCCQIAVQYHEMPTETKLGKEKIFERLKQLGFSLVLDDDTHRGSGRAVLTIAA